MMKYIIIIFNKLRYIMVAILLVAIGTITVPFIIFFNWNGIWVLYIANEEGCSIEKAKAIFKEGKKYQFINDINSEQDINSYKHSDITNISSFTNDVNFNNNSLYTPPDIINNIEYCWLEGNIFNDKNNR